MVGIKKGIIKIRKDRVRGDEAKLKRGTILPILLTSGEGGFLFSSRRGS